MKKTLERSASLNSAHLSSSSLSSSSSSSSLNAKSSYLATEKDILNIQNFLQKTFLFNKGTLDEDSIKDFLHHVKHNKSITEFAMLLYEKYHSNNDLVGINDQKIINQYYEDLNFGYSLIIKILCYFEKKFSDSDFYISRSHIRNIESLIVDYVQQHYKDIKSNNKSNNISNTSIKDGLNDIFNMFKGIDDFAKNQTELYLLLENIADIKKTILEDVYNDSTWCKSHKTSQCQINFTHNYLTNLASIIRECSKYIEISSFKKEEEEIIDFYTEKIEHLRCILFNVNCQKFGIFIEFINDKLKHVDFNFIKFSLNFITQLISCEAIVKNKEDIILFINNIDEFSIDRLEKAISIIMNKYDLLSFLSSIDEIDDFDEKKDFDLEEVLGKFEEEYDKKSLNKYMSLLRETYSCNISKSGYEDFTLIHVIKNEDKLKSLLENCLGNIFYLFTYKSPEINYLTKSININLLYERIEYLQNFYVSKYDKNTLEFFLDTYRVLPYYMAKNFLTLLSFEKMNLSFVMDKYQKWHIEDLISKHETEFDKIKFIFNIKNANILELIEQYHAKLMIISRSNTTNFYYLFNKINMHTDVNPLEFIKIINLKLLSIIIEDSNIIDTMFKMMHLYKIDVYDFSNMTSNKIIALLAAPQSNLNHLFGKIKNTNHLSVKDFVIHIDFQILELLMLNKDNLQRFFELLSYKREHKLSVIKWESYKLYQYLRLNDFTYDKLKQLLFLDRINVGEVIYNKYYQLIKIIKLPRKDFNKLQDMMQIMNLKLTDITDSDIEKISAYINFPEEIFRKLAYMIYKHSGITLRDFFIFANEQILINLHDSEYKINKLSKIISVLYNNKIEIPDFLQNHSKQVIALCNLENAEFRQMLQIVTVQNIDLYSLLTINIKELITYSRLDRSHFEKILQIINIEDIDKNYMLIHKKDELITYSHFLEKDFDKLKLYISSVNNLLLKNFIELAGNYLIQEIFTNDKKFDNLFKILKLDNLEAAQILSLYSNNLTLYINLPDMKFEQLIRIIEVTDSKLDFIANRAYVLSYFVGLENRNFMRIYKDLIENDIEPFNYFVTNENPEDIEDNVYHLHNMYQMTNDGFE